MNDGMKSMEADYLKRAFEHAPRTQCANADLVGYLTKGGNYVCADCGASIMTRGCRINIERTFWAEEDSQEVIDACGPCICCKQGDAKQ